MGKKAALILFGAALLFFSVYFIFISNNFIFGLASVVLLLLSVPLFIILISKSDSFDEVIDKSKDTFLERAILFTKGKEVRSENSLDKLAEMTENRLYMLSSVFPFDFFSNKIYIDQKQIIIIYSQFFWTYQDYHVLVEDILMPVVETGLFFATLRLELGPGGFMQNPPPITFLKKSEALKTKRIIMGLLICRKEKIDFMEMTPDQIVEKVEEIGRVRIKK